MAEYTVSVQAEPTDLDSWLQLARRLESSRFHALLAADHPGSGSSPWPALGCAAAVTNNLRLGTYVAQGGVREPMHVAADAASLAVLAPHRVLLGIGAGHTPREWEDIGRQRPSAADRAARLVEFVEIVVRLLDGDTVRHSGRHFTLNDAHLDELPTSHDDVTLVVGGGHPEILRVGARHARVVALSGLGRTLADGHQHTVRWSAADLAAQLQLIRAEAARVGTHPKLEVLIQRVAVTTERDAVLRELSDQIPGATPDDLATTPFLLIGTLEQMAAQLQTQADKLAITSYVVRQPAVADLERVRALAGC